MPVLIVDDNSAFVRVARAILEEIAPAFDVHAVETAAEALAFFRRQPPFTAVPRPAFVVLDYHLPDLDAPALLERLRGCRESVNLRVLVLSQADWEEDRAAAMRAGATRFCVKPSRVQPLRELLEAFWREQTSCAHGSS